MTKRIIYPIDNGKIGIIIPSGEIPFDEVCRKDVPAGTSYKVIDVSDLPEDRTFRDAWEADFSNPDGEGIGHEAWFAEQAAKEQTE